MHKEINRVILQNLINQYQITNMEVLITTIIFKKIQQNDVATENKNIFE